MKTGEDNFECFPTIFLVLKSIVSETVKEVLKTQTHLIQLMGIIINFGLCCYSQCASIQWSSNNIHLFVELRKNRAGKSEEVIQSILLLNVGIDCLCHFWQLLLLLKISSGWDSTAYSGNLFAQFTVLTVWKFD